MNFSYQKNLVEYIGSKMGAILFWPQCVNAHYRFHTDRLVPNLITNAQD